MMCQTCALPWNGGRRAPGGGSGRGRQHPWFRVWKILMPWFHIFLENDVELAQHSPTIILVEIRMYQGYAIPVLCKAHCTSWLAMSGVVSVSSNPQMTDIFVFCWHVENVVPTHKQHSSMSANFFGCQHYVGETCCRHTLLHARMNQY